MKYNKWTEKAEKLFNKIPAEALYYEDTGTGTLFTQRPGFVAYYTRSQLAAEYASAEKGGPITEMMHRAVHESELANCIYHGEAAMSDRTPKKAVKFENNITFAVVNKALLKDFPKDALYYISGPNKPVLVCLEDACFTPIGMVMPCRAEFKMICRTDFKLI